MVKRIFSFLNKESNGINEAALLLGIFAFISQILGLVRDRLLAYIVGPGATLDVYYAAFRIPDFLYISIASLASITVLMPFMMDKINKNNDNNKEAHNFLSNVFSVYMLFMFLSSLIVAIFMPYIARYIAPGFTDIQISLLVTVSRIMLLSPIFIGLSNLIGTVTQLFRNFFIFALSPIFYSLGILFGIICFYPIFGIYGLAYGVVLGAFMHLLIQVPFVLNNKLFPKFIIKINWSEIWQVVKSSLPRTITLSCNSLAFIFLISLASTLKAGSISLFTFSFNLQSVPVGIIGISYSVAAFPILIRSFSNKDMEGFMGHIFLATRQIIFWSLPIIALFVVLRAQIVRVILGSNTFSWSDTRLTAAAVGLFVISLVTQGLVLLYVRGYYAAGNTKKPLLVNVFSSFMVVIFAYLFIFIFKNYPNILSSLEIILRVQNVPGTIMLALPIAYALGSILNFFLIWFLFKKDFLKGSHLKIGNTFRDSLISALSMGFVSYISLSFFDNIFNINTGLGIFLQGFISGILGIIFGIIILFLLKNKELKDLLSTLNKKFWRKNVVGPEQTEL
jgi:putative peptidoglycan lipid II flippase